MPPPPLRKASVLAIPTMTNGAIVPSVGAIWSGAMKSGCATTLATRSSTARATGERRRPLAQDAQHPGAHAALLPK